MAVSITIDGPPNDTGGISLSDANQVMLEVKLEYISNQRGTNEYRTILIYFHGEEKVDGEVNDTIHLVVKP